MWGVRNTMTKYPYIISFVNVKRNLFLNRVNPRIWYHQGQQRAVMHRDLNRQLQRSRLRIHRAQLQVQAMQRGLLSEHHLRLHRRAAADRVLWHLRHVRDLCPLFQQLRPALQPEKVCDLHQHRELHRPELSQLLFRVRNGLQRVHAWLLLPDR